jgi:hypothetical protein
MNEFSNVLQPMREFVLSSGLPKEMQIELLDITHKIITDTINMTTEKVADALRENL